jgi:hypothetical protein
MGALAAATLAAAGTDPAAAAPAMNPQGFPVGYTCYRDGVEAFACYPHSQRVPSRDKCYPAGGGKVICYPESSRVAGTAKLPPVSCYMPDASVSYICSDVPVPEPPPPPPPPGVMPN